MTYPPMDDPATGDGPEAFARCSRCEHVHAARRTADGDLRPVGTDGECVCGHDEFEPFAD